MNRRSKTNDAPDVRALPPVSRRDFIRLGGVGIGMLALGDLFPQAVARAQGKPAKARTVIQLWMGGGPTQTDTFDPKPEAGEDVCGPLRRPIATNVAGIRISELLPNLAKQADKYTILRSMTHGNNGHETAAYIVQTGTLQTSELVYPSVGAVVSLKKGFAGGYKGLLPPYITLTSPLGRFNEAGFLGPDYQMFATGGNPNSKDFAVQGLVLPREVTQKRLAARRELLRALDTMEAQGEQTPEVKAQQAFQQKAYELMLGDARKAFDLSQETDTTRDRYGRTHFGQSCLLARRLAEYGVPYITVNYGGWDTHRDNFAAMNNLLPPLDKGFSALLEDLAQRGLLESTIVLWIGEFGRTPKVATEPPWEGGRHHFGQVFSAVVAGGGFKGGAVVGSTDFRGERVQTRPVYPWDLSASMYQLLGIDPAGLLPHPQGCIAYVTPLAGGDVPSGGVLKEIM